MARAGCKTNGLQKIEGDDVEKSLEVLDKVLLEFEDPDSLPHIEPESPSQGNQSEDDGYMSMNGRRTKTSLDFHQPSDESSASPPVTDTIHVSSSEVADSPKPLDSPPPPEIAEAIISNLLPRASSTVTTVTIGESLSTEDCEKLHNEKNRQTHPNREENSSTNITTLSIVSTRHNIDEVQDSGGGRHNNVGGIPESSTTPLQTTLPKTRPTTVIPSRYSSLPCAGPPKGSSDYITRGMSSGSFDDGRNVLGMGISAVHDAVLRGSVARLPEPIVNEHPVTIYPGRASPPRTRVPPRTLPGSIERHREVCRNINSIENGADNVDSNLLSPLKRLAVTKSPSSPLVIVGGQHHFIRNIKSSHQLGDLKGHLNNLFIPPRKQNGEGYKGSATTAGSSEESEDFSDDSLEGQSLPPPPPPPVVPPPPSLSAPVTPSKRGSIAWEINLDDHLPPPPPLQSQSSSQHQSSSSAASSGKKKSTKGKIAPLEISSASAKVIARRRGRSMSGSQSSLASTPGNSVGSATNRYSPHYQPSNKSGSMEWPEPPDPPICSTEDEAGSIYSDSDEIIPNYPANMTGKETYVIRKGRRERKRISDLNVSISSSINSRLSSEGNLSGIVQNSSLFLPNSRHSIDLGSSSHIPTAVHNPILSPRSRLSLDLSSPNSTSELPQTAIATTATINGVSTVPQHTSNTPPRFQDLKGFNMSFDALQIYESNGNEGAPSGGSHHGGSSNSLNNNNNIGGSLTRVSSLPSIMPQLGQNEGITTPRRELAPPIEEDEEQDSESQRGAPLRQIESNISALLRGDIAVARVGDLSHPRRPLGFRPGVHKSESAKEMLLSQANAFGPLPPSPPSSSPEPESDGFPPLPPSPQENAADDEDEAETDILHGMHGMRISSRTRLKNELHFATEHPPAVPPHRGPPSLSTLKTRSMDAGYTKKYSSTSPHGTGPGTLPGELPASSSRRRLMSGAFPKRSAQSPREEKRLQTSCSLPETPIFARGCDIPRTPHRRAPEVPSSGSRTAPRTNTPSSLGSSIVGIGSTLGGGRQRSISQALASGEMLRLAGGPARGWYPKQRNMRPASTEHLDRLHRSQGSMRAWDSGGGIAGPGGSRKPLTLPPNLTPKFFNKSPREALRRVTSLLIRKGNGKDKESKREKEAFMQSAVHRSPGSAGDIPVGNAGTDGQNTNHQHKKKGFFKSFWKKSKHISLDQ